MEYSWRTVYSAAPMATTELDSDSARAALDLLEELIEAQRGRVLAAARQVRPGLSEDDLVRARQLTDVQADPRFRSEDGQLAGLVSARIALRTRLVGPELAS